MPNNLIVKPGALIVLEGPDGAGKSTQLRRLGEVFRQDPTPLRTRQPRGSSTFGKKISNITDAFHKSINPLALQLLHLASHAQQYEEEIFPALKERGVLLDRCWWSAVAYGFFGNGIERIATFAVFEKLALLPAQNRRPDVVLLFKHSWTGVPNAKVQKGYDFLAERYASQTVCVPPLLPHDTTRFLVETMLERGALQDKNYCGSA